MFVPIERHFFEIIYTFYFQTLVIDQSRILEMRDKSQRLTIVASALLLTYSTVGAPIAGVQQLKEQMKTETLTILDGVHDKFVFR